MADKTIDDRRVLIDLQRSAHSKLQPVGLRDVFFAEGSFWGNRILTNRRVTLPEQFRLLEETGRLENFRWAAGKSNKPFQGYYFNDSDVYKWLEAACWALPGEGEDIPEEPDLRSMIENVLGLIEEAQQPDGYLNTYFTGEREGERWKNVRDKHELYCAGHLMQAAVAHGRATGSKRLVDVACRLADHIDGVFGASGRPGTPGHPEIEMALVELYRLCGERRYLALAQSFVDQRGRGVIGGSAYHLDRVPLRELERLEGHAVRGLYLCAGAADLVLESGERELWQALERLWERMTTRQMYVTGGLGARHDGEAFGEDYELPNRRAYAETCAAIASLMWSWRMLQREGQACYADLVEWTLYNGILPGISLDGKRYFYVNPLEADGGQVRQEWYECACCPPNLARLMSWLPEIAYSHSREEIWLHQFSSGEACFLMPKGKVTLRQHTGYPWDGQVEVEVVEEGDFTLHLRIPGWATGGEVALSVNGKMWQGEVQPGAYAALHRQWKAGDVVSLSLPMMVRFLVSHPLVVENCGRTALARGPLLYCLEAVDQPGIDLSLASLATHRAEAVPDDGTLGGMTVLHLPGMVQPLDPAWERSLYRERRAGEPIAHGSAAADPIPCQLKAVPYFAWGNRMPGQMVVWVRSNWQWEV